MTDTIFWDNDGVLVETEELYYQATCETMESAGHSLSAEEYVEFFLLKGIGAWHLLNINENEVSELRRKRNERYGELLSQGVPIIEGVQEILEVLSQDFQMAVVTSSRPDHFNIIHAQTDLLKYFDFIITSEDVYETKPSPAPYLKALERANRSPRDCIVIEDTERGLIAAHAANIPCCVIPTTWTSQSDFSLAAEILESAKDLVPYLQNEEKKK